MSNKYECENMETYSKKIEIGKKKVKITLEFPHTVAPKDADRFVRMLKEIYLNKIKVSFPTLKGQCEISLHEEENSHGGMNCE